MKLRNIFWLIFIAFFCLNSCGKKGPIIDPPNKKRPKFDNISDEL